MAQQTINVGASANDGTGTPLRTAFQYTNSNFSELYTAVGPSGNNIVVPGTATITGDLTVDTSTLKVDSANNRVGIVKTTPAYPLDVGGRISYSGAIGEGADTTVSSIGTSLLFGNAANWSECQFFAGGNLQHRMQSAGVFTWLDGAGGTRMTLNSTGLGVGLNPSSYAGRLVVGGTPAATSGAIVYVRDTFANGSNNSLGSIMFASSPGFDFYVGKKVSSGVSWFSIGNANSGAEYFQIDSSGNVVVGTAAVATTATDGFLYVTGCAGTPTGTPTSKTGRVPIVVDTTNNKLYFYSGGSWVAAN
jgi:hypothetical protein